MTTISCTDERVLIRNGKVSAYRIPTDGPESDGTIEWDSTTLVLVQLKAGDKTGLGYTYASEACALLIQNTLLPMIQGCNALDIPALNALLIKNIRNLGNNGLAMMAVSAIDNALWDLKAKIMNMPLALLLGRAKDEMLIYGSGGFTSYPNKRLREQFAKWVSQGIGHVKMKIGREPNKDVKRIRAAREAIGEDAALFVDANGAYTVKQAIRMAHEFSDYGVSWFEEPVTSDNLEGLKLIREHSEPAINIAAGEYGFNAPYFCSMLSFGAVDVLQADATRCGGISGFLTAGRLCEAFQIPFSSHCAPSLHLHAALALPTFYIAEYFYDHTRIEDMLFDGIPQQQNGLLKPDLSLPGFGWEFKHKDAEPFKI